MDDDDSQMSPTAPLNTTNLTQTMTLHQERAYLPTPRLQLSLQNDLIFRG